MGEAETMSAPHILVVEDVLLIRNQLRIRLQSEGSRITVASNVSQALRAVRAQMPDLVVLDLTLPDEDPFSGLNDGFAFLRLMNATYAQASAVVIVYTGNKTPEIEARAKAAGVSKTLAKNEGVVALLSAIRSVLEERKVPTSVDAAASGDQAAEI